MSEPKHTPGPWRWEYNPKTKTVIIAGGRPKFDLTVMDFVRSGMSRAIPRFRDCLQDGMDIMHRLCDRPDWTLPIPGREHHSHWIMQVSHPDACLIITAPCLLARLESMAAQHACGCGHQACKRCEDDKLNQEVIARAKGGAE